MALKSRSACIQPRGPSNCILRRSLLGIGCGTYMLCAFLPASAGAQGLLDSLFKKRTGADLLPPEKAFKVRAHASGPDSVTAVFELAPGYYLYRDRIQFGLVDSPDVALRPVTLPKGVQKKDPTFGLTEIYREPVEVRLQLDGKVLPRKINVLASYQGCEERRGVCYPPTTSVLSIELPSGPESRRNGASK